MASSSAANTPMKPYSADPTLYLYTSLTAGSSHITTATSRLQTILKANKIPFQALDVATDEKARMLWGRRAGQRKLPGLVRMGTIIGDLVEIEELNEFGELKAKLANPIQPSASPSVSSVSTTQGASSQPAAVKAPISADVSSKSSETTKAVDPTKEDDPKTVGPSSSTAVMRQIGEEAAKRAAQFKASKTTTGQSVRFQTTDSPRSERNLLPELARSAGIPPPSVIAKSDVKKVETPSDSLVEAAAEPLGSSGKPVHPETVEGKPILEEEKPMVEKEKEKGRPTLEEKKPAMEEEDKESGQFPVQPALKAKESKDAPKTQAQSPIDGDAAGISVAD